MQTPVSIVKNIVKRMKVKFNVGLLIVISPLMHFPKSRGGNSMIGLLLMVKQNESDPHFLENHPIKNSKISM